jgi:pimeloyl-ACP methyl ester carboxylesterase
MHASSAFGRVRVNRTDTYTSAHVRNRRRAVTQLTIYRPRRVPREEQVQVRGLAHRVLRFGPASDDPVVLLHGWLDTADTFQFLVDAIASDLPFAAFDWRGFGGSEWSDHGYWFPEYLADLDLLLERLCPAGPARLVGHSMGGNIALIYAGIRPERVRRVVSLEGFGLPRSRPADAPDRYRDWLQQLRESPAFGDYPDFQELAHRLQRGNPRLVPEIAMFVARAWARPSPGGVRLAADPAHKLLSPYLYRRDEAEACWNRIAAPALMVLAGRSEFLPRLGEDGTPDYFRRWIPGVRVEVLPELGHMLHHERPAEVARLVEEFLLEE